MMIGLKLGAWPVFLAVLSRRHAGMSFEHSVHIDCRSEAGVCTDLLYRFIGFHQQAFEPFNPKSNSGAILH